MKSPRLRTVDKSLPPFTLNNFPSGFAATLGKEIVYLLATKGKGVLEGDEWESIFATCIGAEWKPSNVGLDDVVLGNTCWGAKTVKATKPSTAKRIRLISGRNSTVYSYGGKIDGTQDPNEIGAMVLEIWNERVSSVRERFKNVRTVVLIKSEDLSEVSVFEFDTIRYDQELFAWEWNENGNLKGIEKSTKEHRFTWQPHGSQFTIIEEVPDNAIVINVKQPPSLNKNDVLKSLGFDNSWVTITEKNKSDEPAAAIAIKKTVVKTVTTVRKVGVPAEKKAKKD